MTPPSDRELAQLQLAAYEYPDAAGVATPFPWSWKTTLNGEPAGFVERPEGTVIIIPGTRDRNQWRLNFEALPETTDHPLFGKLHAGFYDGCEGFAAAVAAQKPKGPLYIIGHSRGAAQAPDIAALLSVRGIVVSRLVLFAPPRPGTITLSLFLAGVSKTLYRNTGPDGHDYVTDVPFSIPMLAPYCQVGPLTDVHAEPLPNDEWGCFRFHHMQLYAAALAGNP